MMATGSLYQPPGVGEMQSALEDEDRLEKLLAGLEGRSRSAAPLQSGRFAVLNLEPLSDALRESRLRSKLEVAKKKKADIQGQYMEEVARRLRQFREKEEGQTQVTPLLDDQGEAVTNKLPGNPLAYDEYMSDPYPEVRKLAESREKGMDKLREALAKRAKMTSVQQNPRNPLAWEEQPELEITPDGIFDKRTGDLLRGTKQVPLPGGEPGQQANLSPAGKLSPLKDGQTINIGEQKAGTEVRKAQGRAVVERGVALGQAFPRQLRGLESAEQQVLAGTIDGPLAKWEELAYGLAAQFGLAGDSAKALLARSELRNSDIGRFVLETVRALGANPSNADRVYAELTAGGKQLSREGQLRVIEAAKADLINDLLQHNRSAEELGKVIPEVLDSRVQAPSLDALRIRNYQLDPEAGLLRPLGAAPRPAPRAPQQSPRVAPEGSPGTQPTSGRLEILYQELADFRARGDKAAEANVLREILRLGGEDPGRRAPPAQAPAADWTKDPAERKRRLEEALRKYGGGR